MQKSLFAALSATVFISALHAADTKKFDTVRCRVFAVGAAPAGDVYVKNKGKYEKIAISTDFITPSFRADAKEGITFFRKKPAVNPKDKKEVPAYEPFAGCAPQGTSARQLVIIAPQSTDKWNAVAKSDIETEFPHGTRLVFNLSSSAVAFDFGGTKLSLKPKQSGLLAGAKSAPEGIAPIKAYRQTNKGEWELFISSVWRQSTDERNILLVYTAPGGQELSLSSIQDQIEAKDDEEKK